MKKLLLFVLGVLIALPAQSTIFTVDGLEYYILDENTVAVAPRNKVSGFVKIPEEIEYEEVTYTVVLIGEQAFMECYELTGVVIPETVTSIGDDAFNNCDFGFIWLGSSVTSIGKNAFRACNLQSIEIPASVSSIGEDAFYGNPYLCEISFESIESMCSIYYENEDSNPLSQFWDNIFSIRSDWEEITDLVIPNSVTEIGQYAFFNGSQITSVTIPNSVTKIGNMAFASCENLISVSLPASLKEIGYEAFEYCNNLTSVYYNTEHPVFINTPYVFSWEAYENATLYVPESAVETFNTTLPWSEFKNIEPYDFSGIEDIVTDGGSEIDYASPYEVYNLNGQLVGNTTDGLDPGVYIIRQGKVAKKIMVK